MKPDTGTFVAALPAGDLRFNFSTAGGLDSIACAVQTWGLQAYETPLPDLFTALVRACGGRVLDVGANTGLFGLLAVAAHPSVTVRAFEPLPSVGRLLRANLALNPDLANRIEVADIALSDSNGSVTFYETINDVGLVTTSSSLEESHASQTGVYRSQMIETRRLDDWRAEDSTPISLMKIDVEGHEYAMLAGARSRILRDRPFMTIEVLGGARVDTISDLLASADYLDFAIAPHSLRLASTLCHHGDAWNHLLCPIEKAAILLRACRELRLGIDMAA